MRRIRHSICLALVGAMGVACRHAVVAPVEVGTSSVRFVEPPPPRPSGKPGVGLPRQKAEVDQVTAAQAILPLANPIYPPAAFKARAGTAKVGVRITIDPEGRVSDTRPSLTVFSTPTLFAAEFQAAVEAAVAQWRFRPAEVKHLEMVAAEGGPYMRLSGREKWEWAFDVEFTFSASGDVLTGLPK